MSILVCVWNLLKRSVHLSVATNGFFAGIETKSNRAIIRAYKVVLEEILQETVDRIDNLEVEND